MSYYRRKPTVVVAHQWFRNGDHPDDFADRAGPERVCEGLVVRYFRSPDFVGSAKCDKCGHTFHEHGFIDTAQGGHRVCPGDWIITLEDGENYPCKPDVFARTYVEALAPEKHVTVESIREGGRVKVLSVDLSDCLLSINDFGFELANAAAMDNIERTLREAAWKKIAVSGKRIPVSLVGVGRVTHDREYEQSPHDVTIITIPGVGTLTGFFTCKTSSMPSSGALQYVGITAECDAAVYKEATK